MTFEEHHWKNISDCLRCDSSVPDWARHYFSLSFYELLELQRNLQEAKLPSSGQNLLSWDIKIISQDFLEFLRTQIELEPRGPDWTATLRKRLISLKPFVDQALFRITFGQGVHRFIIRYDPETGLLVSRESY